MRAWGARFAVAFPAAAFLLVAGAHARADPLTDQVPGSSPAQTTVAPAATPAPTPAPTQAPSSDATPKPRAHPAITPWPWPFPWMQPTPAPAAQAPGAAAAGPSGSRGPADTGYWGSGGYWMGTGRARRNGAIVSESDATTTQGDAARAEASGAVGPAGTAPPADPVPGLPPASQPATSSQVSSAQVSQHQCEYKAIEHGITGDRGAIYQVIVRGEDCHWGASQVLLAFDARGPPAIDVLAQSAGMSVDVEAYVTREKMLVGLGYAGRDGAFTPARPVDLDPALSSTQRGDNRVEFVQDALSSTGDAVSGSQRIGLVVVGDAAAIHVLAQNAAPRARARSGDASSSNDVAARAGSQASGTGADAQSGQVGDNTVDLGQNARARSGDAISGSQEIDVSASGSVGELDVLAQNDASGAKAISGDATATNRANAEAGPQASSGRGAAQAGQIGDNRVRVEQTATAVSGDAISGSQVIGIHVGGSVGDLGVLASNDADGAVARSGDARARNDAHVVAGPVATSQSGDAMSAQSGDNDVTIDQTAEATSGRALAGAQLISIEVGGAIGRAAVMPSLHAVGARAISGTAVATNDATGHVGPQARAGRRAFAQQSGDNTVNVGQDARPTTGDAVAGSQVVGLVSSGSSQVGGPVDAEPAKAA